MGLWNGERRGEGKRSKRGCPGPATCLVWELQEGKIVADQPKGGEDLLWGRKKSKERRRGERFYQG